MRITLVSSFYHVAQAAVFGGEHGIMLGAARMAKDSKQPWQVWLDRRGRVSWLRVVTLIILLLPAAKALIEANAIAYSARPLNELIHRTGFWALMFLGLAFAITPLRRVLRYGPLIDVRRMIGVASFIYIAAHLSLFFADQSYSFVKFFTEITKRIYLIIGAFAWIGLAVLAATSTDAMVRRLGGMRWRRLHQTHLRDFVVGADPLFPADQGRHQRADFHCRDLRLADGVSGSRLVAGQG